MSFSKNIRKKRRHSRKRIMRGGGLPTSMAILSYNTSFVLSMDTLFPWAASENTSIYIRLMKLKSLMGNTDTDQNFITNNYGELFSMSCRIIAAFFVQYESKKNYCVAALQEMNLTQHYLTTMGTNFGSLKLNILACGVQANNGTGLAYIIPNATFANYKDKVDANEWFANHPLYSAFNANKVAIVDLGEHQIYRSNNFYKIFRDGVGTPDNGRPMTLIIRNEPDNCYTLHFNCHIPNPSALKCVSTDYAMSLLEEHSGGNSTNLDTWAVITHQIINEEAYNLLLRFFSAEKIATLTQDNCRIIFSGDFNDGTGRLMSLMTTQGLTVANSGLANISIMFSATMPRSCCSNFNSVQNPLDTSSPPSLKLAGIDQQRNSPATDPKLLALLNSPDPASSHNYIVDAANYAFVGDGTASNIALTSQIYDPTIASGIPNIDYLTLTNNNIRGSDHMPVISYTPAATASSYERTRVQRAPDVSDRSRRDDRDRDDDDEAREDDEAMEDDEAREDDEEDAVPDLDGGYRKKRRSKRKLIQRKLSQRKLIKRKSKRHTKKRNYRKNKK